MRIAIISDIHGNGIALDAALADVQQNPVDQIVCLGDAAQGGPQPAQVVARLREVACPVVMSNADAWLLSGQETGNEQIPGGHTHLQQVRRIGDSYYFNPGSVGLAYSHQQADDNFRADPWAEYAVLTLGSASLGLEFRRVAFDTIQLTRAYRESGRPYADEAIFQYEGHR